MTGSTAAKSCFLAAPNSISSVSCKN
jgi:hypothetical protein